MAPIAQGANCRCVPCIGLRIVFIVRCYRRLGVAAEVTCAPIEGMGLVREPPMHCLEFASTLGTREAVVGSHSFGRCDRGIGALRF